MSAARPPGRDPKRSRAARRSRGVATAAPAAPEPRPAAAAGATTALLEPPAEHTPAAEALPREPRRRPLGDRLHRPRAPRHRLLLVCTGVLAIGLLGVLLLNTIISQGAFRQHELEVDLILISEEEEALARAVQQAEAPIEVERRARELGMVPAAAPVFLRLSDGAILGEPVPAPKPTGPVDFTDAPGLTPPGDPDATADPEAAAADASAAGGTAEAGAADGTATGEVADPLIDPNLDPATGLADGPSPSPAPQASTAPSQPSDGATPGPAPGARAQAGRASTQGATP